MSAVGGASFLEQQAQQFENIITEAVSDDDTRAELIASVRAIARTAVESIMADLRPAS